MTKVTRSTFKTNTSTLYPDNTSGQISPADLRTQMDDVADSISFTVETTTSPGASDDTYNIGDLWTNTTTDDVFVCVDKTASNAIWLNVATALGSSGFTDETGNTSSTTQTSIASFVLATYNAAKVIITANDGTDTYVTEMLIAHDGTTASYTEYGQLSTGTFTVTYDVDVNAGNIRILATAPAATATTYTTVKILM